MLTYLLVGAGGFVGSVLRYGISRIPAPNFLALPLMTLLINFLGAFLIGAITEAATANGSQNSNITLMLKVGLCGGFTTFSTFSLEAFDMLSSGKVGLGIIYMFSSLALSLIAVFLGKALVRFIMTYLQLQ